MGYQRRIRLFRPIDGTYFKPPQACQNQVIGWIHNGATKDTIGHMKVKQLASPNYDERQGSPVDILLLHYTGMPTGEAAVARLRDPQSRVSAHYVIEEDGSVLQLVDEECRAWHAGMSYWTGETNINARSIGIELVNPGHEFGYRDFPQGQIETLIELGLGIVNRHGIPALRVLGHSDVAPERKTDPGEKFPWNRLGSRGLGVSPRIAAVAKPDEKWNETADRPEIVARVQEKLAVIGYNCPITRRYDGHTSHVVVAFQRHFQPSDKDWSIETGGSVVTPETDLLLSAVVDLVNAG